MKKFRLKAGSHVEGGSTYNKGDVVESPYALNVLFKEKFEVIHEPAKVSKEVQPKDPQGGSDEGDEGEGEEPLGADVTSSFPFASEKGLRVLQAGRGKHYVVEEDNLSEALNEKPLNKKDIEVFIDEYEGEED